MTNFEYFVENLTDRKMNVEWRQRYLSNFVHCQDYREDNCRQLTKYCSDVDPVDCLACWLRQEQEPEERRYDCRVS